MHHLRLNGKDIPKDFLFLENNLSRPQSLDDISVPSYISPKYRTSVKMIPEKNKTKSIWTNQYVLQRKSVQVWNFPLMSEWSNIDATPKRL